MHAASGSAGKRRGHAVRERAARLQPRSTSPDPAPLRVLLLGANGRLGQAIADALQMRPVASGSSTSPDGAADPIDLADPIDPADPIGSTDPASPNEPDDRIGATTLLTPTRAELNVEAGPGLAHGADRQHDLLRQCRRWLEPSDGAGPDVVINCIAMSDVDRCEQDEAAAMRINAELPAALARAARERQVRLIHFSTDFVFDGTLRRPLVETDPAAPLSAYGKSKLAGEQAIAAENGSHWIFRVSWLYGSTRHNLAATLLDPARAGQLVRLADNRIGVPNPVQLIAREVCHALHSTDAPDGLYHLSCHGRTSWYEFGREFVTRAIAAGRLAPARAPRIVAMDENAARRPARRPPWSVLDPTHYERTFGRKLPSWRDAIAFALSTKTGRHSA